MSAEPAPTVRLFRPATHKARRGSDSSGGSGGTVSFATPGPPVDRYGIVRVRDHTQMTAPGVPGRRRTAEHSVLDAVHPVQQKSQYRKHQKRYGYHHKVPSRPTADPSGAPFSTGQLPVCVKVR
ncbi:hypothetical protein GCM10023335_22160 [Streptomyces siamensis]|uniref:Uncharacterized protein n=1 Tax=Streptomyces siamensis TaxID=1274986 RepID=A0ABP9IR47_9ACTN